MALSFEKSQMKKRKELLEKKKIIKKILGETNILIYFTNFIRDLKNKDEVNI
jgi:hypothetical protein